MLLVAGQHLLAGELLLAIQTGGGRVKTNKKPSFGHSSKTRVDLGRQELIWGVAFSPKPK